MDNLTHTLVGMAVGRAGLARRCGRGTILALALASNLPDVDAITARLLDGPSFLHRRMFSHSIVGVPLLAAGLAALLRLRYRSILLSGRRLPFVYRIDPQTGGN